MQLLATMPLDEIPSPTSLPHGSVMPTLSPNPLFVGREDELKALAAYFRADDITAVGQVEIVGATGLGGIGKTQLASEFIHRYGQYFAGGIFWLSFTEPSDIPAEVAACGVTGSPELGSDFGSLPFEVRVRRVMSAWQSELPRLLVFDNCEDEQLLAQWRPRTGGSRVLVTSRRERWDPTLGVETLQLDVLSWEESVALLAKHRTDLPEDDPELNAIAQELGDLPLALVLAGRFLAKYRLVVTPNGYVEELRRPDLLEHQSLQEGGISPTGHEQNVARTFALSYEQLDTADPTDVLAVALLARAARLAPSEPIPHELQTSTLHLPNDDLQASLRAEDALSKLTELGLIATEAEAAPRMHRLVAVFTKDVTADGETQGAVEEALLEVVGPLVGESDPTLLAPFLPHLRAVADVARLREDERAERSCRYLGRYLTAMAAYEEARPYLERNLEIRENVYGKAHRYTATSLRDLGKVLQAQGAFEEAKALYERALSIREEVHGKDDQVTAQSLNDLADVLYAQGHYEEAWPRLEQALAIQEKVFGEEHPQTAISLAAQGMLLNDQGHYKDAEHLHRRALAIREKVLGEEHPDTAASLVNLANALHNQEADEEAKSLYERSLTIFKENFGEEHPQTAATLDNLATLIHKQEAYDEARSLHQRALAIRQKIFGEEHPETATSLNNLGVLLYNQDKFKEALPYLEQALAIRERIFGEENPQIVASLNNLANVLYYAQGHYQEARTLYERALTISKEIFGEEHPQTATSLNNLALVIYAQGQPKEALPYLEQALVIREKVLGEEHSETANTRQNLARVRTRTENVD